MSPIEFSARVLIISSISISMLNRDLENCTSNLNPSRAGEPSSAAGVLLGLAGGSALLL
jgi:hypothetical protein